MKKTRKNNLKHDKFNSYYELRKLIFVLVRIRKESVTRFAINWTYLYRKKHAKLTTFSPIVTITLNMRRI